MENFVAAVQRAVGQSNWYSALSLALILPDICGRLEKPGATSKDRYIEWFDLWVKPKYTQNVAGMSHTFLSGRDCYALRCAVIHEGRDDTAEQRARDALSSFKFNTPHPSITLHCNQMNNILQLQVDLFCRDICDSVEKWLRHTMSDAEIQERKKGLLVIHDTSRGIPGILSFG